jgi:metallo-beta-lactamase family protein
VAELTFVGAAGVVTGSKHLLTVGGKHVFVDCGMYQGPPDVSSLNTAPLPVPAAQIDAVIITHGHLDHVGYLPQLVRDGFRGTIYCTPPTQAVMRVVLEDSASLQQEFRQRGFQHHRTQASALDYDIKDVDATMQRVHTVPLHEQFDVLGVMQGTYCNAAHIIGSAFIALSFEGKRVIFSGDLGRYGRPLLYDPDEMGPADAVICESTYASEVHPPQPLDDLRGVLLDGLKRHGPIVIPAFAIERTQDILVAIARLQKSDAQIAGLPVHLDSPMADKVDDIFERFPDAHKPIPDDSAATPFGLHGFTVHRTTDESKALNALTGAYVIVAASGMASGGRILHHLHTHLSDPRATIIFPGYQGAGTLGSVLVHGAKHAKIYNDMLPVRATVVNLKGFSAHADSNDFTRWFHTCPTKPHLYAVHGEPPSSAALVTLCRTTIGWKADVAVRGTTVTL